LQISATQSNAHSGFETCGLYPYNPEKKIPEEGFSISDSVCLPQLMTIIGQTSIKAQTLTLAQELNQVHVPHHSSLEAVSSKGHFQGH
jgi:hypothetical protein